MSKSPKWTEAEESLLLSVEADGLLRFEIALLAQPLLPHRGFSAIQNRLGVLRAQSRCKEIAEGKRNVIKPIGDGCRVCGAKADGKFCEEHARAGFPKNMSTDGLIITCGQPRTKIKMPKLRETI